MQPRKFAMSRVPLAVLLVALTTPVVAQAPRITPAGDPSIKNDTIYRLAVNPADHTDEDYIYLLDDGVVRFEADGRGSRTYRQVVQILNQDGAETWGDQTFSYSAGHERLTVNWLKVLRLDGSVISDKAAHQQESQADAGLDSPSYSDERTRDVT